MTNCTQAPTVAIQPNDRLTLVREAFRLEWLTIGWMTVEAVVAIASGLAAGSLVLFAFGLDSVIELASAGVLMWRLIVELRHGQKFSETAECIASRVAGTLLILLAAYVVVAGIWRLWTATGEEFSWPGGSGRACLEVPAAISGVIAPGVLLGAEVRQLSAFECMFLNREGLFLDREDGHALSISVPVYP